MAYSLATSFAGEALLSGFNWFDGTDPTHGFVSYQNRSNAEAKGLFSVDQKTGVVRLGVDHTNVYNTNQGRPSIRLESKESFDHGLFIADFLHMPPSQCGLWPAFWIYGPNWPDGGEVDVVEGVNTNHHNSIAAHTKGGCTLASVSSKDFSGVKLKSNCAVGSQNIGCGFASPPNDTSAYGDGFNAVKGGVYAMDWDHQYIKIWHFQRGNIPKDIEAKKPDPRTWPLPTAVFGGSGCQVDSFFSKMKLVINTDFCGDWGNAAWGKSDQCNAFAPTCSEYVAKSPQAFANAYWDVRYIERYQVSKAGKSARPMISPVRAANMASPSPAAPVKSSAPAKSRAPAQSSSPRKSLDPGKSSTPVRSPTLATKMTLSSKSRAMPSKKLAVGTGILGTGVFGSGVRSSGVAKSYAKLPSMTQAPNNPAKIGKFAYLGCFGSRSGFQTFSIVKDSDDMSLETCVKLCNGKTFAGLVDSKCLCAQALDGDTRAMGAGEGATCDHPCPGRKDQHCGGLRETSAGMGGNSTMMPDQHPFTNATRMSYKRAPAGRIQRRKLPGTYLLSVYGDVAEQMAPAALAPPPPMAAGGSGSRPPVLVTQTAYRSVYLLQSGQRPYPTNGPIMSGRPLKLGSKPKLTYQDMPKPTPNSAGTPDMNPDDQQTSTVTIYKLKSSTVTIYKSNSQTVTVYNSNASNKALYRSDPSTVTSTVTSTRTEYLTRVSSDALNSQTISTVTSTKLVYTQRPSAPTSNLAAAAFAAQPNNIDPNIRVPECGAKHGGEGEAAAEPSPASPAVFLKAQQLMVAGNRMARSVDVETDAETAPSNSEQDTNGFLDARSPDGLGALGPRPQNSLYPEGPGDDDHHGSAGHEASLEPTSALRLEGQRTSPRMLKSAAPELRRTLKLAATLCAAALVAAVIL